MQGKYAAYYGQPHEVIKTWKAALYIRLSREDEDKEIESYSVTSQREILKEYLKLHPDIEIYDFYVDDGYSGTNFDRPDFQRMMVDITTGNVNCVIVKDLSRFCRNAVDGGRYLDDVFVRLQVRFIAINNCLDTLSENMNAATRCITVGVQNVINESVAATTSVNVRGTLNVEREQGKFIGSFPTYGYLKDPEDHHKLIVDEATAPIIRQIFEWFIEGKSIIGIAKLLNEQGIPNPSAYKKMQGWKYHHTSGSSNDGLWPDSSVRRILTNQMYLGHMVQGKNTTISYKIKQCRAIPKEDWIIVKNTHEAIIDQETFDKAQALINRHIRKAPKSTEVDLLAGFMRCSDCHRIMNKKKNTHSYGTYEYYRCATRRKMKTSSCGNHTVRADKVKNALLVTVQKMVATAIEMDELLEIIEHHPARKKESSHLQKTLQALKTERSKMERTQDDLYPDWKNGVLTQQEYLRIKANLTEKIEDLTQRIGTIEKTLQDFDAGLKKENSFLAAFKKYGNFTELTRPMLVELLDEILVYPDGEIEIHFKFRDAYQEVLEYMELNSDIVKETA